MSDRPAPVQLSVFVGSDSLRTGLAHEHKIEAAPLRRSPSTTSPSPVVALGWWVEIYQVARGKKLHHFLRVAWRDRHGHQCRKHIPRAAEAIAWRMESDRRPLWEVLEAIAAAPRVRKPGERG